MVIIIEHDYQGQTIYSLYAHLSSVNVSVNTNVYQPDIIGVIGRSGYGSETGYTGKHLHFAITKELPTANFYGYDTYFTGNVRQKSGITFCNPKYIIDNNSIPT